MISPRILTGSGVDVSRFEIDDSLVILDSEGYFESNPDILSTFEMLAKRAETEKDGDGGGCSVISDMGSFSFLTKEDELLEYERSLPLRFSSMKCKGFCCYHLHPRLYNKPAAKDIQVARHPDQFKRSKASYDDISNELERGKKKKVLQKLCSKRNRQLQEVA
jgi:hypothetical protein